MALLGNMSTIKLPSADTINVYDNTSTHFIGITTTELTDGTTTNPITIKENNITKSVTAVTRDLVIREDNSLAFIYTENKWKLIGSSSSSTPGNGVLTITVNNESQGTFSANQSSNSTINISVPTQASDINALSNSTRIGSSLGSAETDNKYTTLYLYDQNNTQMDYHNVRTKYDIITSVFGVRNLCSETSFTFTESKQVRVDRIRIPTGETVEYSFSVDNITTTASSSVQSLLVVVHYTDNTTVNKQFSYNSGWQKYIFEITTSKVIDYITLYANYNTSSSSGYTATYTNLMIHLDEWNYYSDSYYDFSPYAMNNIEITDNLGTMSTTLNTLSTTVNNISNSFNNFGNVVNYNVPTSGNATSNQVVLGSDTRLTTKYIPLAGTGTDSKNNNVTGSIIFGYNDNGNITGANGIKYYSRTTSNYVSVIRWSWGPNWYEYTDTQHSNTPYNGCPQIGYYNGGGTDTSATTDDGSITILPYVLPSNGALPWDGTVGLHIKKNHVFIDGSEIITEAGDHLYKLNNSIMLNPRCKDVSDYASGNYNYLLNNGFYMSTGSENAPTTGSSSWEWWMGSVLSHNDNYVIQDMWQFTYGTDPTTMPHKMRIKCNGTWGNWTDVHLTDTTYSVSTGDSNGQIKITPSSGNAYNVNVKGLGSAAYTASTAYLSASGTATAASKLSNTSKIGDTNKPVYFTASGVPSAISYTIDKSVPSSAVFTDENVAQNQTTSTASNLYQPILLSNYATTSATSSLSGQGTSPGTTYFCHNLRVNPYSGNIYIAGNKVAVEGVTTYAGSSTSGGSATTAEALTSTSIGNSSKPVYFNASGKPVACTYTLSQNVTSSSVLTDENVYQSSTTTTNFRPVLLGYNNSTSPSSLETSVTEQVYTCSKIFVQPSTGDLTLYSDLVDSADSPSLVFRRGTASDTYTDWRIYDHSGWLYFGSRNSGTWTDRMWIDTNGNGNLYVGGQKVAVASSKSYDSTESMTKGGTKGSSPILITDDNDKDHIIQGMTIRESATTLKVVFKDSQNKKPLYSIAEIPYFVESTYDSVSTIHMNEYDEKSGTNRIISVVVVISIEYIEKDGTITLTASPQDDSIKLPYIQTVYECD